MTTFAASSGGAVRLPTAGSLRPARGRARPAQMHLTRRGRLVVLLVALAVALGGSLAATRATAEGPVNAPQVERYVVSPGDSLWALASDVARPGQDLRDVVRDIELLNGMSSVALTAGQEILLPVTG